MPSAQLLCLAMIIVSILGNLWTPPVGRTFGKVHTIPMLMCKTLQHHQDVAAQ